MLPVTMQPISVAVPPRRCTKPPPLPSAGGVALRTVQSVSVTIAAIIVQGRPGHSRGPFFAPGYRHSRDGRRDKYRRP